MESQTIRKYALEQYINALIEFHGVLSPGILIAGFMVSAAIKRMAGHGSFRAICESPLYISDAVQMLTPCTIGNGCLKIINTGRFALIFYNAVNGTGVRVTVDPAMLKFYPVLNNWFFHREDAESDREALLNEIRSAADNVLSVKMIRVAAEHLDVSGEERMALCPLCGEVYYWNAAGLCFTCQGKDSRGGVGVSLEADALL